MMRESLCWGVMINIALAVMAVGAPPQENWGRNREAIYSQREAMLKHAVAEKPNDVQALVNLADFYLLPTAPEPVETADGRVHVVNAPLRNEWTPIPKNIYAVSWVFRGDPDAAKPVIQRALQLDPKNVGALRDAAMCNRMMNELNGMETCAIDVLRVDPLDLDACRLHLDFDTLLAHQQDNAAQQLRQSHVHSEPGYVDVTVFPSPADLAKANQIDQQAKQSRSDAAVPLLHLIQMLKDDPKLNTDPAKKCKYDLANAIYLDWIGDYGHALGAAKAAINDDPTNLAPLDFMVDIARAVQSPALQTYKPILDRWCGGDSTPEVMQAQQGPSAR